MSFTHFLAAPDSSEFSSWWIGEPAVYLAMVALALAIALASVRQMLTPIVAIAQAFARVVAVIFVLALLLLVTVAGALDLPPIVE